VLKLEQMPLVPGGELRGEVNLGQPLQPDPAPAVRLRVLKRTTKRKGKRKTTSSEELHDWKGEAVYNSMAFAEGFVPVQVKLPAGLPPYLRHENEKVFWYLTVTAQPESGALQTSQFDLPVFEVENESDIRHRR
jgi:hypothetical protein